MELREKYRRSIFVKILWWMGRKPYADIFDKWIGASVLFSPLYWAVQKFFDLLTVVTQFILWIVEMTFHLPFLIAYWLLVELPLKSWWSGLSKEQRLSYIDEHRTKGAEK